jgi:hypothetical protein
MLNARIMGDTGSRTSHNSDVKRIFSLHMPAVPRERVTYSTNGWMTEPVALKYIEWLSEHFQGAECALVMG